MNEEVKTIDELEIEVLKSEENMNKFIKKTILWTVIAIIIIFLLIWYLIVNSEKFLFLENLINYIYLSMLGLAGLILIIIFIKKHKKNPKNRSCIIINTNKTQEELLDLMTSILKELYYKEKKYFNENVFYAYKTHISVLNVNSLHRYLNYKIIGNNVLIEAWFGNETPIDSSYRGLVIKQALLYDLKYINYMLTKEGEKNE